MTHDEYASLVFRLEAFAAERPTTYRLRVGLLAGLGYAYIGFLIVILIGLLIAIVWGLVKTELVGAVLKVTFPILALIAALARSLWVTLKPPTGRTITRRDAPALFAQIDELRRAAQAPAPHRVIISNSYNASVAQVPRLGLFGWPRNYLVLGLPLLNAMTVEQYRFVLAHEFAHLSRAHQRFTNWIYRVRGTWAQVTDAMQQRRSKLGGMLVQRFLAWYSPYLNGYSFALMRAHEIEADRIATAVVGTDTARASLIALSLRDRYQQAVVWPAVRARIIDEPEPPRAGFAGVVRAMPHAMPLRTATQWLTAALTEDSDLDDPHPALGPRLAALGLLPATDAAVAAIVERLAQPIDPANTAAAQLLGSAADSMAERLDADWRANTAAQWKDRRRHLVRARDGLRALMAQASVRSLTADERLEVADWTEDLEGSDTALPLVRALVQDEPDHAGAQYMLGRILLADNDVAGVELLERAIRLAPGATAAGTAMIAAYLRRAGQGAAAIAYETRSEGAAREAAAARAERSGLTPSDRLVPADITDDARETLCGELDTYPQAGRAWFARKVLSREGEAPYYVLLVKRAEPWWRFVADGSNNYLARKLADELTFPGESLVVILTRKRRWLSRMIRRVPESEIYRRDKRGHAMPATRTGSEPLPEARSD